MSPAATSTLNEFSGKHTGLRLLAAVSASRDQLIFSYKLTAPKDAVIWPPSNTAQKSFQLGLWEQTCLEAFLTHKDTNRYLEFNFAPSGSWAVLGFKDYRQQESIVPDAYAVDVNARELAAGWELKAKVHCKGIFDFFQLAGLNDLKVGLSAVLEHTGQDKSYWALVHPAEKPDFHDRSTWLTQVY